MNGKEFNILETIYDEIQELRRESGSTSKEVATTKADVKNLVGWVSDINERLGTWQNEGCAHGKIIKNKVENLEKNINDTKDELKKTKVSKKLVATISAGAATIISTIVNAISTTIK